MKRTTIAPAFLLVGALLIGSLSACTQSNASDTAQPDTTVASPASSSPTKNTSASSDASKPDATAANPASSASPNADAASSDAAKSDAVAANPATSASPKADTAERAKKREEVRKQVAAVLTPEQATQLDTKVKGGEKMRKALTEINLTADQKTKIKAILKAAYPRTTQNGQKPSDTKAQ